MTTRSLRGSRPSASSSTPTAKASRSPARETLTNLVIPATNPTNPTGQTITLIQRRLVEGGPRVAFQETDTYQAVAGLRGKFGDDWTWETSVNYGRNSGIDGFTNIANKQNVANTLNRGLCSPAPGAAIPCADYLGAGDVTADVLRYIMVTTRDTGGNESLNLTVDTTGRLFELPAGPLQMAAGVAYRKDSGWRYPDNLTVLGIANTNQQTPINGSIKAAEAYAEFDAPLLRDLPGIERLSVNGAVRYSDYDRFGSDTNYKVSLDWSVGYGLRLRSTWGTAFRVPSVAELFGGVSEGQLTTSDPCSRYASSTNTVPGGQLPGQRRADQLHPAQQRHPDADRRQRRSEAGVGGKPSPSAPSGSRPSHRAFP